MSTATVDTNPTKATPGTALDWALKLAGWGLRIFPLKPDKTPAHVGWQQEATTNPEIIHEWLDGSELYGVLADGDLVLVDLDRKKGKDGVRALANACSKAGLDVDSFPTFTVRSPSGGGLHLYFRSTEKIRFGADMLGPGSGVAAAITSEKYTSRVLGVSDTATVPTSVLWLLTGNNVRLAGDMPTRVLKLYLDSKEERPDRRSFHRDLIPWVTQHRPRIVAAVLVIVRAYLAAGCPRIVNTVTRFPAWDRLVRLPLIHAGGQDVALKFDDAFTDDPVLSAWADVLEAWHDVFSTEAMRLSDVVDRMEAHSLAAVRTPGEVFDSGRTDKAARLKEALKVALNDPRRGEINPGSLGKRLAQYENRPLGGMKLVRVIDTHTKGNRWAVQPTG